VQMGVESSDELPPGGRVSITSLIIYGAGLICQNSSDRPRQRATSGVRSDAQPVATPVHGIFSPFEPALFA
jgi:hypothetical protein